MPDTPDEPGAPAPRVLLTVSGTVPDDLDEVVAAGRRPRADYSVLADRLPADVVDVPVALSATGRIGRIVHRVAGTGPLLAWYAFRARERYDVVLTDGEQVGIPLALLTRFRGRARSTHVMIVHILSVPKKAKLIRWGRLAGLVDRYVVYCERQAEFVRDDLGVPAERVVVSTFMVDTDFFAPQEAQTDPTTGTDAKRPTISSAGLERRDYPTLMAAVDGLPVDVVIAAASPWSKRSDSSAGHAIPDNVTIRRLDLFELRALYAASSFVVMPLFEVDFQAGITTILEAMSMERAIVCSRTAGQIDTIVDGETGVYVEPGDAAALRAAIEGLLADPARTAQLGRNARRWVVANADIDRYADAVASIVAGASRSSGS